MGQRNLRREMPHLEFLARLFIQTGPTFVQGWITSEPTGQYVWAAMFEAVSQALID